MCRCGPVWGLLARVNGGVVEVMCVSAAGYVKRLTQLTAYGTCTDVRNEYAPPFAGGVVRGAQ